MIDNRKWEEFAPSNDETMMSTEQRIDLRKSLHKQIATKRRRLRILEEKAATYGLAVPADIIMQIEDTQHEIQHHEGEMQRLGSRGF